MKRLVSLLLSAVLVLTLFSACSKQPTNTDPTETTAPATEPGPTESPEEAKALKIMILGSSRSVNTFQLLYEVFKDQMPDQELVLGIMYYSGCSMTMHANFIMNQEAVYRYYYNATGKWVTTEGVTMEHGLTDQAWDIILLQAGNGDTANNMNESVRKFLKNYVDSKVPTPHTFWWHSTWFNSTDPQLYVNAVTNLKPENIDQYAQLTSTNDAAKEYVLNDPMFAGHITSGTPMMYALKILGVPEIDLYRDHTHLSDFGCLLVGYAWYAQFTGKPVTEIKLTTIPKHLRHRVYQSLGDMTVTEEMKDIILKTVDYTMKNPWAVPVKE